jgi:hypothetical protein
VKAAAVICLLCCGVAQAQLGSGTPAERSLLQQSFGKPAFIRSGIAAGWGFIRNSPHEWGRTTAGFGKQFASSFGRHLVKGTVQFGVGALRKEDLTYHRSDQAGFGLRLRHALVSTLVARKTTTGRPTMALSRVSGNFAGGFVSRLWQPARLRTVGSGFATTGISFGADAGVNVIREFWPEIRHPRRRRPAASGEGK